MTRRGRFKPSPLQVEGFAKMKRAQLVWAAWRRTIVLAALCQGDPLGMTSHSISAALGSDPASAYEDLKRLHRDRWIVRRPFAKPSTLNRKRGRFMWRPAALPPYGIHPKAGR